MLTLDYRACFSPDGNSYGFSVHADRTREALAAAGVQFDDDAPVAFRVASPLSYAPVPGKVNVAYVAWETEALPEDYAAPLAKADLVLVTAPWLHPVFARALPGVPVKVAPLGVDASAFPFRRRRLDRRKPFRFLWLGAPNARKGYEMALEAWRIFEARTDVELYMKTTVTGRVERHGNIVFDSRNLSAHELTALYHSAHAFLFPTFGEGFGLTLFEALATGCPAAWTDCTAPGDFLDSRHGYPVCCEPLATSLGPMRKPDLAGLARAMVRLREDLVSGRAQRKARRAADRIRKRLTWAHTAEAVTRAVACVFQIPNSRLQTH